MVGCPSTYLAALARRFGRPELWPDRDGTPRENGTGDGLGDDEDGD